MINCTVSCIVLRCTGWHDFTNDAAYNQMDLDIRCPECENINLTGIDLNDVLSKVQKNDTSNILKLNENFTIELKPYTLDDRTILQIQQMIFMGENLVLK